MKGLLFLVLLSFLQGSFSLNNGLALTPPMGWMDWERFRCNIDCDHDPNNCIGEKLFMDMADRLYEDGYAAVGYNYVDIDDCWLTKSRDANGNLVANPKGFLHGIKALADYVHSKGLLLGIYEDFGTLTCGGFPGSEYHLQQDALLFAKWGVDALKLDGCYAKSSDYPAGYTNMSKYLLQTGRKIMYSCSWPAYIDDNEKAKYYPYMASICNIWRNWDDIQDSYASMSSIANYWGDHSAVLAAVAKPGSFNDADQLIIGNSGLNQAESQSQMALWAVMASPLLMSNDLRNISSWAKEILLNKEVIAVNQDPLGRQGIRVSGSAGTTQVWIRQLSDSSYALLFWNDSPVTAPITGDLSFLGGKALLRDLFLHKDLGVLQGSYTVNVVSHGCFLFKATPAI